MFRNSGRSTPSLQSFTFHLTSVVLNSQDIITGRTLSSSSYAIPKAKDIAVTLKNERCLRPNANWAVSDHAQPFQLSYVMLVYASIRELVSNSWQGLDLLSAYTFQERIDLDNISSGHGPRGDRHQHEVICGKNWIVFRYSLLNSGLVCLAVTLRGLLYIAAYLLQIRNIELSFKTPSECTHTARMLSGFKLLCRQLAGPIPRSYGPLPTQARFSSLPRFLSPSSQDAVNTRISPGMPGIALSYHSRSPQAPLYTVSGASRTSTPSMQASIEPQCSPYASQSSSPFRHRSSAAGSPPPYCSSVAEWGLHADLERNIFISQQSDGDADVSHSHFPIPVSQRHVSDVSRSARIRPSNSYINTVKPSSSPSILEPSIPGAEEL
jgi:hypothetical protein